MKILNVIQGSDEWNAIRDEHPTASEASIMAGASKHTSRSEFIRILATGNKPEIGAFKQRIFDKGHEVEAAARPLAEAEIGAELYPVTALSDDGYLLASFDGVTLMEDVIWECKQWNETKAADVRAARMPEEDYWQTVQQRAVCRGARLLYTVTDGTSDKTVHLCLPPVTDAEVKALLAHWKQFEDDVANYQHVETKPAAVASAVLDLPAVSVQVTGSIAIADNFKAFETALTDFIGNRLIREPKTDQDFADLDSQIKTLKKAEEALESAEAAVVAQVASIDAMKRTKDMLYKLTRDNRLMAEKLLANEKERRRAEIMEGGKKAFADHVAALNSRLGKAYMPPIPADFAGAMKGKKTIASLQDAVSTELARAKIAANEVADRIDANLKALREHAKDHAFLFADTPQLVLKANDDLMNVIKARIAEHQEAEQKRLAAEQERIRAEEERKANERLEQEKVRIRQEEEARAAALAAEKTTPATIQAVAAPSHAVAPVAAPAPAQAVTLASEVTPRPMAYSDRPGCVTVAIGGSEWNLSVAEAETLRAHLGAAILTAKAAA